MNQVEKKKQRRKRREGKKEKKGERKNVKERRRLKKKECERGRRRERREGWKKSGKERKKKRRRKGGERRRPKRRPTRQTPGVGGQAKQHQSQRLLKRSQDGGQPRPKRRKQHLHLQQLRSGESQLLNQLQMRLCQRRSRGRSQAQQPNRLFPALVRLVPRRHQHRLQPPTRPHGRRARVTLKQVSAFHRRWLLRLTQTMTLN